MRIVKGIIFFAIATAIIVGLWYMWTGNKTLKKSVSVIVKPHWEDYFPLSKDLEWRYQYVMNQKGNTLSDRLITKVVSVSNGKAKVQSGWRTIEYLLKDDGVVKAKSGNYLIKEPIEKGASWEVKAGKTTGKAIIKEVGGETVAAGKKYSDCLLIQEQYRLSNETLILQAWYAKGVGLVKLKSISRQKDGSEHLELSAELEEVRVR